jgi:uncharacterized membrane protein
MQYINRHLVEDALEEYGGEVKIHRGYSGRGMFGEQCLAVYGPITSLIAFSLYLGAYLYRREWESLAEAIRIDQFGTGHVAYFPGWQLTEPTPENEA